MKFLIIVPALIVAACCQQYTTPVPILKQINKHNEDGSYSYGYEGADGSFKIETKYPTGEVQGKYGYVDDTGKLREIEYGASRRGFEPVGTDINVPPPTLNNNNPYPLGPNEEDDGQYREDPSVYFKDSKYNTKSTAAAPVYRPQAQSYNSAPNQYYTQNNVQPEPYKPPQTQHRFQYQTQPQYQAQPQYQPQPQTHYQPQSSFQSRFQPTNNHNGYTPNKYNNNVNGLTNLDLSSGSYSLSYTG